jgi:hypothetical protein
MQHKVGEQGLVVPFGYVTATYGAASRVFQQGMAIPAGWTITDVQGDSENDQMRSTAKCCELLGIKAAKPAPQG